MKINEIFYSIQGESLFSGMPCVFIRLTGCNLRCLYCDTIYAYDQGTEKSIEEVVRCALNYQCNLVEITGGEPLLQTETPELAKRLANMGKTVLVETNGTLGIETLEHPVIRIMDIKCPGSGEAHRVKWGNIEKLRPNDEIKFVIGGREDFDWAKAIIQDYHLSDIAKILFSPVSGILKENELANWILEGELPVRLNIQLHKYISLK